MKLLFWRHIDSSIHLYILLNNKIAAAPSSSTAPSLLSSFMLIINYATEPPLMVWSYFCHVSHASLSSEHSFFYLQQAVNERRVNLTVEHIFHSSRVSPTAPTAVEGCCLRWVVIILRLCVWFIYSPVNHPGRKVRLLRLLLGASIQHVDVWDKSKIDQMDKDPAVLFFTPFLFCFWPHNSHLFSVMVKIITGPILLNVSRYATHA